MKAIRTRYKGPTNNRGARIMATDDDGNRVTVPYRYGLDGAAVHAIAAKALVVKMGWGPCRMIAGGLKDGYAFVFAESDAFDFGVKPKCERCGEALTPDELACDAESRVCRFCDDGTK